MNEATIIDLSRETVLTIVETSMPLLLISLVIGLIISIFQTITSIQEQTLTFVPKMVGMFVGLMILGHWMLNAGTDIDFYSKVYRNNACCSIMWKLDYE